MVAGAGVFGVTAALALGRRGHEVTVVDPGPLPHPLAESTDISKIVRLDYGADEGYVALAEEALAGWRRWNRDWGEALFHETGVLFLARAPMAPGGFEHESLALLARRGHRLERLDAAAIARRFPAYRPSAFLDGYLNPAGGYAEAGAVMLRLLSEAAAGGAVVRGGAAAARLLERGGRIAGAALAGGEEVEADAVVVAAGAWASRLVPWLAGSLSAVGQPVFHLVPDDPAPYRADCFPVFGADIAETGYYGFPANADGVVKIANHGVGVPIETDAPERAVSAAQEAQLRSFLRDSLPGLATAPIVYRRLCVYCDTRDEHFWIAPDPDRAGLVVATGGSGHAFKFAPVLGDLIADAVEGAPGPQAARFRWRPDLAGARGEEAARHRLDR